MKPYLNKKDVHYPKVAAEAHLSKLMKNHGNISQNEKTPANKTNDTAYCGPTGKEFKI